MTSRTERTRAALQGAALQLFTERGFDHVTVEEVATAAGVSHMTFFRYFPTKEAVVLDDPYDPVLGDAVRAQPAALSPLERVRRALLMAWGTLPEPGEDETRARVALVAGHDGLRAKAWANNQRTQDVLADALVEDGVPPLEAQVAAGACLGALMAALLDWGAGGEGGLGDRISSALGQLAPPPIAEGVP
ncbi:TetR family transcriptional regulator [Actinotalea sp. BY-33]|uniref:TetR family transcriptional regulator n=1 Tax=Actinotalea soli TaxID=2819234 RepID=A0A939LMY4_9CELL|nr:TetR family transcriptional regulator [Actinotalea soli]MBO1750239.1 TetR family transcriptional regulator [Actinotalea soli]